MRTRYEPPRVDADAEASAESPSGPGVFTRVTRGAAVPWTLNEVAANSAPAVAMPSELELEHLREQARQEGLADGRAELEAELARRTATMTEHVHATLDRLATLHDRALAAYRHELAELALAVAQAVIQRELAGAKDLIETMLQAAIVEMDPHERCTLTVSTRDESRVTEWAQSRWPAAVVRVDGALEAGELRVDAPSGMIEVGHAARIQRVRRLVLGDGGGT